MHRIDADANVAGQFGEGDPSVPTNPTEVDAAWLNAVQEQICTLIEANGVTLVKGTNNQLLAPVAHHAHVSGAEIKADSDIDTTSLTVIANKAATAGNFVCRARLPAGALITGLQMLCTNGLSLTTVDVLLNVRAEAFSVGGYGATELGTGATQVAVHVLGDPITASRWETVALVANPTMPTDGYLEITGTFRTTRGSGGGGAATQLDDVTIKGFRVAYTSPVVSPPST